MITPRVAVGILLAVAATASICEPGETITYVNSTNATLFAEVNDRGEVRLPAERSTGVGYTIVGDEPVHIEVRDATGCVVIEMDTTMNLLKEHNNRSVEVLPRDLAVCSGD